MEVKIKVCGMRNKDNIRELLQMKPDFIGFILFPGSQRYLGNDYQPDMIILPSTKKVGVFVNALIKDIIKWKIRLGLDYVQLHGSEAPEYCKELQNMGIDIIKAFGISEDFNFDAIVDYLPFCDYFLFDTKTPIHGGSGQKYEWEIIKNYKLDKPFFLSGGIKPEDVSSIVEIKHKQLYAIDINSGFEIEPALKDIQLVNRFINSIRTK